MCARDISLSSFRDYFRDKRWVWTTRLLQEEKVTADTPRGSKWVFELKNGPKSLIHPLSHSDFGPFNELSLIGVIHANQGQAAGREDVAIGDALLIVK